jgi:hypothetical protein
MMRSTQVYMLSSAAGNIRPRLFDDEIVNYLLLEVGGEDTNAGIDCMMKSGIQYGERTASWDS